MGLSRQVRARVARLGAQLRERLPLGHGSGMRHPVDLPGRLRPASWLVVGLAAAYAYQHAADFTPLVSQGLPYPLFPTQAIILSVLLVTPARHWALYLMIYYAALVLEGMVWWSSFPRWYLLVSNVANVVEPLVGALLLRCFIPLPPPFFTLREVGIYAACVAAASAIGATWGATTRSVAGFPFWPSLRGWFLADVLASLLLVPTILLCVRGGWRPSRSAPRRRQVEAILLCLSVLVVGALVFGGRSQGPDTAPALLYLPVPLLVWAAVRFGPRGLMWTMSLTLVLAIAGVVNGGGPFVEQPRAASVFILQMFLLAVGMPLFCLAALVQERQRDQAKLEQSEERYRIVVRNLPRAAVLLFGTDRRHLFADGQELASLGVDRALVEGKTLTEGFPDDVAAALAPHYLAALAGASVSFDLVRGVRKYEGHALPIDDAETIAGMVVLQEVTEERRAKELAALEDARTAFFNHVSSQLREPLTLVLAPLQEVLARPPERLPMEIRETLEIAQKNGVHLLKLVNTLVDLSRLAAGRVRSVYTPTDLATYTAAVASSFRSTIEQAGMRLVVHCPPLPEPAYVDRQQWEQIVFNLLSHALTFASAGEIIITVAMQRDQVMLRVHDTAGSIPAEELPHLFEPFRRLRAARASEDDRAGVGLTLVRELVQLQGGTVRASSSPGRGSTIVVTIPRGSAHLPADQIGEPIQRSSMPAAVPYNTAGEPRSADRSDLGLARADSEAPLAGTELAVPVDRARDGSGRPARLLVVDDDPDLRTYVAHLLGGRGTVRTAGEGRSALEIARAWRPDLMLTGVTLPDLSGIDLLRAIRADPDLQSISVILLSTWVDDATRTQGLRAGADDFVPTPFTIADLLVRVDGQLWLARMRSEAWAAAERERLALDLHDSVMQSVYSLTLMAEAARRASASGNEMQVEDCLGHLSETAQQTLREMRLLVSELRPPALSELGLVKAIDQRLEMVERRAGLTAPLVVSGKIALPSAAEEAFYYIALEALNNVLKHADATTVVVRITGRPGSTELIVADNGRGFDTASARGGGVGLVGIRQRAARVGATVEIGPRRQGGSQVVVRLDADAPTDPQTKRTRRPTPSPRRTRSVAGARARARGRMSPANGVVDEVPGRPRPTDDTRPPESGGPNLASDQFGLGGPGRQPRTSNATG